MSYPTKNISSFQWKQQEHQRQEQQSFLYRDHFHAQRLNNTAASFIDDGEYGKAVALLVKALCLSPINKSSGKSSESDAQICACQHCSLDECIVYSEERAASQEEESTVRGHPREPKSKKRKIDTTFQDAPTTVSNEDCATTAGQHYIHDKPIRIAPEILHEAHIMGPTLSLIVTFNLALANHLKLISSPEFQSDTATLKSKREKLGKVLKLYELAYQWESQFCQHQCSNDESNDSSSNDNENQELLKQSNHPDSQPSTTANISRSLRFDMMVCNNLSEIHRMAQNLPKQQMCLQHLLSIMMYVVDCQRQNGAFDDQDEDDNEGEDHHQQQQQQEDAHPCQVPLEEQSNVNDSSDIDCTSMLSEDRQRQEQPERIGKRKRSNASYMDMDGFWCNITPNLLRRYCADAA